jgi:hypothetical protein
MVSQEELKTMILNFRDGIKNAEKQGQSCEGLKRNLKQLEDSYRYHYEGGSRPSNLPSSSNNTWVGCHKCD